MCFFFVLYFYDDKVQYFLRTFQFSFKRGYPAVSSDCNFFKKKDGLYWYKTSTLLFYVLNLKFLFDIVYNVLFKWHFNLLYFFYYKLLEKGILYILSDLIIKHLVYFFIKPVKLFNDGNLYNYISVLIISVTFFIIFFYVCAI